MKTQIYAFAQAVSIPEQGGSSTEQHICRTGSYGSRNFHPCFTTRKAAEAYKAGQPGFPVLEIVTLELRSVATQDSIDAHAWISFGDALPPLGLQIDIMCGAGVPPNIGMGAVKTLSKLGGGWHGLSTDLAEAVTVRPDYLWRKSE